MGVILETRSLSQQINASNPIIGTEIGNDGQIAQPMTEVMANAQTIYLSFYLDIPEGKDLEVTYNWLINGQPAYSYSKTHTRGQVVTKIDRLEWGLPGFNKGDYLVEIRSGDLLLTSTSFKIK